MAGGAELERLNLGGDLELLILGGSFRGVCASLTHERADPMDVPVAGRARSRSRCSKSGPRRAPWARDGHGRRELNFGARIPARHRAASPPAEAGRVAQTR
jgi:hypothetical protein